MTGIELMAKVRETSPDTRLLLLTAYADTDVAIRAINDIGLDYYMFKPWEPPETPALPGRRRPARGLAAGPPRRQLGRAGRRAPVVRPQLRRQDVPRPQPHPLRAGSTSSATRRPRRLLDLAGADHTDLPLVLLPEGDPLRAPTSVELADALGLRTRAAAAALRPVHRRQRPGRPGRRRLRGVRGSAHRHGRARRPRRAGRPERRHRELPRLPQGRLRAPTSPTGRWRRPSRFGAETVLAREVVGLEQRGPVHAVRFADGGEVESRAVLVATGVAYRRLEAARRRRRWARAGSTTAPRRARPRSAAGQVVLRRRGGELRRPGGAQLRQGRQPGRACSCAAPGLEDSMSEYLVARITAPPTTSRCASAPRSSRPTAPTTSSR